MKLNSRAVLALALAVALAAMATASASKYPPPHRKAPPPKKPGKNMQICKGLAEGPGVGQAVDTGTCHWPRPTSHLRRGNGIDASCYRDIMPLHVPNQPS